MTAAAAQHRLKALDAAIARRNVDAASAPGLMPGALPGDIPFVKERSRRMPASAWSGVPMPTSGPLLYVGPVLSEFGHELFIAALARAADRDYGKTVVCSRPSRAALYADFAEFIGHDIECESAVCWPRTGESVTREQMARWAPPPDAATLPIHEYRGGTKHPIEFVVYGQPDKAYAGCLAIHARQRAHVIERNWPVARWQELLRRLRASGVAERVVCIGTAKDAAHIPGTEDARGLPLHRQMDVLRSAAMAIGPSSGPMHLASLCKCPHVVWCGGTCRGWSEVKDTQSRYMKTWNPFGTPVIALSVPDWRPAVGTVWAAAVRMHEALNAGGHVSETSV